jgi:hypothetical protein
MHPIRSFALASALCATFAFGDVISGTITDADNGSPLAGVRIAAGAGAGTLSGNDGKYSLNTTPASLADIRPAPSLPAGSRPEPAAGAYFTWDRIPGRADPHNALGARIPGLSAISGYRNAPLAKASARNALTFSKTGYTTQNQTVDGSRSGLDIKLKKATASRKANLTWFESYPDPGSEECVVYNGCTWAGQFAALDGKQPESWVKANNICAVHERDFAKYKLKTLRLVQGNKSIDVKVYDMCSDSDCDGCCTKNAASAGFLIDVEKYTAERFGTRDGVVDWTCIDCTP